MDTNIENEERGDRKKTKIFPAIFFIVFVLLLIIAAVAISRKGKNSQVVSGGQSVSKKNSFEENFQKEETINETAKISESANPDWWVNSGGLMTMGDGIGKTVQGDLAPDSEWFGRYKKSNPEDTDGGLHPQNIFRLVGRHKWDNLVQEAYFRIDKMNFSESPNRNESNGILLMSRYQDGDDLYYTGLRVDGSAIIKKKYAGKYYTLSEINFFPGEKYDREKNPNSLPLGEWIGLRSELRNTPQGDLEIKLYVDEGKTGSWKLAASVLDDGRKEFGKHIISDEGYVGIRTDFMDVEFSGYKVSEL
jgi:hypothetical protein